MNISDQRRVNVKINFNIFYIVFESKYGGKENIRF